ncbi:unnamed protein product [Paramecium sonneborni]|uniref:Transmembrane protein n=1 Tax=Paramecium sonneborni TaxID=65129 RepID=A0A8S1RJT1_9CILI|nr:unnamed protein product [Paramecium sonneborni]
MEYNWIFQISSIIYENDHFYNFFYWFCISKYYKTHLIIQDYNFFVGYFLVQDQFMQLLLQFIIFMLWEYIYMILINLIIKMILFLLLNAQIQKIQHYGSIKYVLFLDFMEYVISCQKRSGIYQQIIQMKGLLVVLIVFYILMNKALILTKINQLNSQQSDDYFNDILNFIIDLIILMLTIILPIAFSISNMMIRIALLINIIGLPQVAIYYYNLLSEQHQNFIIPLIIIIVWIFVIGPIGIIAPIIMSIQQLQQFLSLTLGPFLNQYFQKWKNKK